MDLENCNDARERQRDLKNRRKKYKGGPASNGERRRMTSGEERERQSEERLLSRDVGKMADTISSVPRPQTNYPA